MSDSRELICMWRDCTEPLLRSGDLHCREHHVQYRFGPLRVCRRCKQTTRTFRPLRNACWNLTREDMLCQSCKERRRSPQYELCFECYQSQYKVCAHCGKNRHSVKYAICPQCKTTVRTIKPQTHSDTRDEYEYSDRIGALDYTYGAKKEPWSMKWDYNPDDEHDWSDDIDIIEGHNS